MAPGGALETLERLRDEGKLRAIGLGCRPHDFHREAIRSGRFDAILTFADYNLYDQMAQNRATAVGFLDRLAPPVAAKERQEWSDIVALSKSQGANFQPTAADWNFYADQIRKQRYALSSDELKP